MVGSCAILESPVVVKFQIGAARLKLDHYPTYALVGLIVETVRRRPNPVTR